MSNVIQLHNREGSPHMQGPARCVACGHKWEAVAPVGTKQLQCPKCHTLKGLFMNPVAPSENQIWTCACGCQLFFIGPKYMHCYQCGIIKEL